MNCKNNSSCCSPYSVLAQQLEETTDRAIQAYNLAVQGLRNPVNENLTIDGDLLVNGDIIQNGSAYETHAEKIYTNDDYIVMRDGAVGALGAGDYSGFQVTKYDGTNDGRLVIDRDGVARVGDVGDEQPLATRDESAQLTDNHILKWDADDLKLVDSGIDADSLGGLELVDTLSSEVYVPAIDNADGIHTINMGPFEAGYDYFLFIHVAGGENANIRARYDSITIGTTAIDLKIQTYASVTFNARLYRCPTSNPLINSVRLSTVGSARTNDQEILVSGVNIKTVGGQSLLGSGDVPAGGLNWTLRTPSDDWTDMFSWDGTNLTALKHVYLYNAGNVALYIPKGGVFPSGIQFARNYTASSSNILSMDFDITINANIASSNSALSVTYRRYTFTTDGTSVSVSASSSPSNFNKSAFTIFVAD